MAKFLKVKCKCGNTQVIFSHSTSVINCKSCNEPLSHPAGGAAVIHGEVEQELE